MDDGTITKKPSDFRSEGFHKYLFYDYYEYNRTSLVFDERLELDDVILIVFISLLYINFFLFVSTNINLFYRFTKYFLAGMVGFEPTTF